MIVIVIIITTILSLLVSFIVTILYVYHKRQVAYQKNLETIKVEFETNILNARLEMQEETFQNISREIHDNINLSLTLCKLNLRLLDFEDLEVAKTKINSSIDLLSKSIGELSDISKSLNSELIVEHGLIKAVDEEIRRIRQADVFKLDFVLYGNPVYMESEKEIIIFRIIQETLNNVIKHSKANYTRLELHYSKAYLRICISDNGVGFDPSTVELGRKAGLRNMENRTKILKGAMTIKSISNTSTTLTFTIPIYNQ